MPAGMPDPSRMSSQERMMYDRYMNASPEEQRRMEQQMSGGRGNQYMHASPEEQRRMEQQTNGDRGGGGGGGGMFFFLSSDVLIVLYLSKLFISELCFLCVSGIPIPDPSTMNPEERKMWEEMKQQMSGGGMPIDAMEEIDLDGPTVQFGEEFTRETSDRVDFDML